MGRGLLSLGAFLVTATVAYWAGGALGWLPATPDEQWSPLLAKAGLVLLAAGLVLRLVSPLRKRVATGRCATCGRRTARGHMYCMDHLQESVNAWRDQTREGTIGRRRDREP